MVEDLLKRLVGINSILPNEKGIALFLENYLKKEGFKVQKQEIEKDRFNLFAERGTGSKATLFYGHIDTVPIYGKWKTNPFSLTRSADKLYGLGSCDMKGGIAAALEAVNGSNKKIKFLFCSDEEGISAGMWAASKRRSWFDDVSLGISVEPGSSKTQTGGIDIMTLGRRGRIVFHVDVQGISVHGGTPQKGVNAILEAAKLIPQIESTKLRSHPKLGPETIFISRFEGSTATLSVPDMAYFEIDMHTVPPTTTEEAKKRFEATVARCKANGTISGRAKVHITVKRRSTPYHQPYVTDENAVQVKRIRSIIAKRFGAPRINYSTSVADDNTLARAMRAPLVTIGPEGGNIHSSNEWVSRKSLNQSSALYRAIIDS